MHRDPELDPDRTALRRSSVKDGLKLIRLEFDDEVALRVEGRHMPTTGNCSAETVPRRRLRLLQQFPAAYEQLKQDAFWESQLHRPKDLTTSKHVLLFLMRAETPADRALASKYAKILDGLARDHVRASQVPQRIRALAGVEAACEHFVAVERESQINGPSHAGLFPEKQPPVRPKRPRGNRRPKLCPWTRPTGSLFAK
jgi:hypothetical protein